MLPTPPPQQWNVLIPLEGLYLSDQEIETDSFLFGDATLLSRAMVEHFFAAHITRLPDDFIADSFLVLRRRGVVNTVWFDEDQKNTLFTADVQKRVKEITSLLTITFLSQSRMPTIVGRSEQFLGFSHSVGIIPENTMQKPLFVSISEPLNATFSSEYQKNPPYSLQEIQTLLTSTPMRPLYEAVTHRSTTIQAGLQKTLIQASVRLVDAIFESSLTNQLLGAFTTIEILLSENQDSTKTKLSRLETLIGLPNIKRYQFKQVEQARNSYVHQGSDVSDKYLSFHAICAALHALLIYGLLAEHLTAKGSLLAYLDIIPLSNKVQGLSLKPVLALQGKQLEELQYPFPFADYIDAVIEGGTEYDSGMYDRPDRVFQGNDAGEASIGDHRPKE